MNFEVIIPARYAASRLPGKLLCDIAGKPLLWHVYHHALASGATTVSIATDDARIRDVATGFGATVYMTSPQHRSGTDRIAEVIQQRHLPATTIVVNVQGDEPLLPPALIRQVAEALAAQPATEVATLCEPLSTMADVLNPNIVKVVRNYAGLALYFSRAAIPWLRYEFAQHPPLLKEIPQHYRHIGIYAYRAGYLTHFTGLPACPLEQDELLEQLRVLFYGGKIYVADAVAAPGIGVDTLEDLAKVRQLFGDSK